MEQPAHRFPLEAIAKTRELPILPQGYPNIPIDADPETFVPPKSIMPKLFITLANRYADRIGGYTRVLKFGRRHSDNAPVAIVSLVDGPRDVKFEMVARTVGKLTAQKSAAEGRDTGVVGVEGLDDGTRRSMEQVLRYRGEEGLEAFEDKARRFAVSLFRVSSRRQEMFILVPIRTCLSQRRGLTGDFVVSSQIFWIGRMMRSGGQLLVPFFERRQWLMIPSA